MWQKRKVFTLHYIYYLCTWDKSASCRSSKSPGVDRRLAIFKTNFFFGVEYSLSGQILHLEINSWVWREVRAQAQLNSWPVCWVFVMKWRSLSALVIRQLAQKRARKFHLLLSVRGTGQRPAASCSAPLLKESMHIVILWTGTKVVRI